MILRQKYDPVFVILSYFVSFLGIYAAVGMAEQLRQSLIDDRSVHGSEVRISRRKKHLIYLLLFGVGVGGVGVWGMHFTSLSALHILDENDNEVSYRTNAGIQILTLFMIITTTTIGLTIACYDDMFSKTKVAIIDQFIEESKRLTLKEIRRITLRKVIFTLATKKLGRLLFGGTFAAIGMIVMLYVSMNGQVFGGHIRYNYGLVALATIVSIVYIFIGYWIFFRLLSIFPDHEWLRLFTAFAGSLAATFGNYLALLSADFRIGDPYVMDQFPSHSWSRMTSFYVAFIASNILLWLIAMFVMSTARSMNHRQGKLIRQAEAILFKVAEEQHIFTLPMLSQATSSANVSSTTSGSSITTSVKSLVEQYLSKRSDVLFFQQQQMYLKEVEQQQFSRKESLISTTIVSKEISAQLLDRELQQNMGFSEYLLHLLLLFLTCKWKKFVQALYYEINSDQNSSIESDSNHDIEEAFFDEAGSVSNNNANTVSVENNCVNASNTAGSINLSHNNDYSNRNDNNSSNHNTMRQTFRQNRIISLEELAENTRRAMDVQMRDMHSHRIVASKNHPTHSNNNSIHNSYCHGGNGGNHTDKDPRPSNITPTTHKAILPVNTTSNSSPGATGKDVLVQDNQSSLGSSTLAMMGNVKILPIVSPAETQEIASS